MPGLWPAHPTERDGRARLTEMSEKATMSMSQSQAAQIGRRVLAGLARGRQRAITQAQARSAQWTVQITYLALADRDVGRAARGRACRIRRKLGGALSERQVKRILDRLSSVSDSRAYSHGNFIGAHHG